MNRRYLAITTLLATTLIAANGCATSSARRPRTASTQMASQAAPPKHTKVASLPLNHSQPIQSQGGLLSEVEAPRIASATKFEDAPSAGESAQVKSMREQMTRRYGCCGK